MPATLLIVDDEKDIRDMLSSCFRRRGYQILTASGGQEALAMAARQPDLILLDVNMPDMDGLEVCRRIREDVSCPILFLTAKVEDGDKIQGFAAGGDEYIVKPFPLRCCWHRWKPICAGTGAGQSRTVSGLKEIW